VDVEWDVTDAAKLERDTAESGITEELVGAEPSFHRPGAVLVLIAVACLIGSAGVVVFTQHRRLARSPVVASATAASSQSGASQSGASTETQAAIARIRDLALAPGPLTRFVRATTGGGCVPASPVFRRKGGSPRQRFAARRATT